MKKELTYTLLVLFVIGLIGCDPGNKNSLTVITTKRTFGESYKSSSIENDSITLKMEYSGHIVFDKFRTKIKSISPGGYISYKKNEKRLFAEYRGRGVDIELSDDKGVLGPNTPEGKKLIA
ncbi:MAG: hypothetical protein EOO89_09000, partial [Pedobacter sp.]